MKNLKSTIVAIIDKNANNINHVDATDAADEILNTFLVLKENDFYSTVVEKGYHYLVKFKSGNYGEVWYNYHGQWMYQFRNVEDSIEKIYTPKTK